MNIHSHCAFIAIALGLAACSDSSESHHATPSPTASQPSQAANQPKNELKNADIPVAYIPPIVVPDFFKHDATTMAIAKAATRIIESQQRHTSQTLSLPESQTRCQ